MREALHTYLEERGYPADSSAARDAPDSRPDSPPDPITALAGDLSQRRYFRVRGRDGTTRLVAHYPPALLPVAARFLAAQRLLAGAGVAVPAVYDFSAGPGFMLLEDLGPETLYDRARTGSDLSAALVSALEAAARIAALEPAAVAAIGCPPLDRELLSRELALTHEHLFAPRGLAAEGERGERFRLALLELCARLAADPQRPCHRDFMVRNLMPLPDGGVAVIDFQDLRLGPPAYDLASLLNDSHFPDAASEAVWLERGLAAGVSPEAYARAVVQRSLKAAGTFARFAAEGKPQHLPLVAPTLERAAPHLARLPETAAAFAAVERWWRRLVESAAAPVC